MLRWITQQRNVTFGGYGQCRCGRYSVRFTGPFSTETTRSFFTLYYYTKQNGEWIRSFNDEIPQTVWDSVWKDFLPEGYVRAIHEKRNAVCFPEGYFIGAKMVYNSNVTLRTGAVWTNEDGSVDVYLLCRNGTPRPAAQYSYWLSLSLEPEGEILQVFGNLDPGQVTVDAGTMSGYLLHLEPDEVQGMPQDWGSDTICYTSGNNSNYQAG